jgi:hypothetical protein
MLVARAEQCRVPGASTTNRRVPSKKDLINAVSKYRPVPAAYDTNPRGEKRELSSPVENELAVSTPRVFGGAAELGEDEVGILSREGNDLWASSMPSHMLVRIGLSGKHEVGQTYTNRNLLYACMLMAQICDLTLTQRHLFVATDRTIVL